MSQVPSLFMEQTPGQKVNSHLEIEQTALMRGEPGGAAFRKACEEFEQWWQAGCAHLSPSEKSHPEVEAACKRIARLAFLEGKGL